MPVITPVERRRQFARRPRIRVAVQDVRNLVRILAMQACEREPGEVRGVGDVERPGERNDGLRCRTIRDDRSSRRRCPRMQRPLQEGCRLARRRIARLCEIGLSHGISPLGVDLQPRAPSYCNMDLHIRTSSSADESNERAPRRARAFASSAICSGANLRSSRRRNFYCGALNFAAPCHAMWRHDNDSRETA